ncbi:potassium channel subfamily K member 1-like [Arctopsyche grandis]|uniref:potassium channel subfamily K member 1-like n=1 Tax=Arctopsyche grandis TaxID=121162 RepID=UPI00406D89A2
MKEIRTPSAYGSLDSANQHIRGQYPTQSSGCSSSSSDTTCSLHNCDKTFCGIRRCSFLLFFYVLLYVAFLVSGGFVFSILEAPEENKARLKLLRTKANFLDKYHDVDEDDLESLIEEVVKAGNRGVSASKNVSGEPNWSFGQSLFFSSTVVTTIGYGHVTPLSRMGKIFCIMYAAIGIPMTLVLMAALVERLLCPATAFLRALNARLGHLYQPFTIRLLHLSILVTLLLIFFLVVPASIFSILEPEWDYLDSLYYCFISLTTIGLGDYIPGDAPNQPLRPVYKVATTFYLLVGLVFVMLTLTVFYDIPQLNIGVVFSSQSTKSGYDPEKMRLNDGTMIGPQYTIGPLTIPESSTRRSVVRVKPHRDDSPSPEDTTPVHARDIRIP